MEKLSETERILKAYTFKIITYYHMTGQFSDLEELNKMQREAIDEPPAEPLYLWITKPEPKS